MTTVTAEQLEQEAQALANNMGDDMRALWNKHEPIIEAFTERVGASDLSDDFKVAVLAGFIKRLEAVQKEMGL